MEKRSLLTLSAMQTMVGRAIRDIKTGGMRETRNALEVCRKYARRPQQREFWSIVKSFLTSSESRYPALLHRAVCTVREESLKTLAINLSCNAFSVGRDLICSSAAQSGGTCWIQWLPPSENMQDAVRSWMEKGVSVFLLDLRQYTNCTEQLLELPAHNSQCIFIYAAYTADMDFSWAAQAVRFENVCALLAPELLEAYAPWLTQQKLFFGVLRDYDDVHDFQQEISLLHHWINMGCLIGVYHSQNHAIPPSREEDLYHALLQARNQGKLELLLWDLERDTEVIQKILLGEMSIADFGNSSIL